MKKSIIEVMKGKKQTQSTPMPAPTESVLDRIARELSAEDYAAMEDKKTSGDSRLITTGFSEKEIQQMTEQDKKKG